MSNRRQNENSFDKRCQSVTKSNYVEQIHPFIVSTQLADPDFYKPILHINIKMNDQEKGKLKWIISGDYMTT